MLDQATVDPQTGKVVTQSPPYPGVDGSGDLFAMMMYSAGVQSLPRTGGHCVRADTTS